MKKHTEIEDLIQKRLDRLITAEEDKVLNLHLDQCPDCRKLNRDMEAVQSSLFNLIDLFPGASFNDRVMSKLGFKKSFAWAKAATVLGLSWAGAALFFFFSPLTKTYIGKTLTSVPQVLRVVEKTRLILDAIGHFVQPLIKSGLNPVYLAVGVSLCMTIFILLGKTLKKEETCSAS
jgi:anti-sigma factor RsiW